MVNLAVIICSDFHFNEIEFAREMVRIALPLNDTRETCLSFMPLLPVR